MAAPLAEKVLRADLVEGLTVAEIAVRHGRTRDYVYGRLRRLGIAPVRRAGRSWDGLAEQLGRLHPREVAALHDCSVATIYWVADWLGIRHLFASPRTIDHDRVRADLAAGMSVVDGAAAHGISTGSVYWIRKREPRS